MGAVPFLRFVSRPVDGSGAEPSLNVLRPSRIRRSWRGRAWSKKPAPAQDIRRADLNRAVLAFEIKQPIAQNAESRQCFPDLGLHRAEIFPHDDSLVAHAFERQNPHEIVGAIADVGAIGRVVAFGNPVEPEKPHDVIDAQRAAVPHRLADRFGIQPVTIFAMLAAALGGGNDQSWPVGEKSSGGEPTRHPAT